MSDNKSSCGGDKIPSKEQWLGKQVEESQPCPGGDCKGQMGVGFDRGIERLITAMGDLGKKMGGASSGKVEGSASSSREIDQLNTLLRGRQRTDSLLITKLEALATAVERSATAFGTAADRSTKAVSSASFIRGFKERVEPLTGALDYGKGGMGSVLVRKAHRGELQPDQVESYIKNAREYGIEGNPAQQMSAGQNLEKLKAWVVRTSHNEEAANALITDPAMKEVFASIAGDNQAASNTLSKSASLTASDMASLKGKSADEIKTILNNGRAYHQSGMAFGDVARNRIFGLDKKSLELNSRAHWAYGTLTEKFEMGEQLRGKAHMFAQAGVDPYGWSPDQAQRFSKEVAKIDASDPEADRKVARLMEEIDDTSRAFKGASSAISLFASAAATIGASLINYQTSIINNPFGSLGNQQQREIALTQDVAQIGGGAAGALAGAGIGSLFGGVMAIPGALIGGAIGGVTGTAAGGYLAAKYNQMKAPERAAMLLGNGLMGAKRQNELGMFGANLEGVGSLLALQPLMTKSQYANAAPNIAGMLPALAQLTGNVGGDQASQIADMPRLLNSTRMFGGLKNYAQIRAMGFSQEAMDSIAPSLLNTSYAMGDKDRSVSLFKEYQKRLQINAIQANNYVKYGQADYGSQMSADVMSQAFFGMDYKALTKSKDQAGLIAMLERQKIDPSMLKSMGSGGEMLFSALMGATTSEKGDDGKVMDVFSSNVSKASAALEVLLKIMEEYGITVEKQNDVIRKSTAAARKAVETPSARVVRQSNAMRLPYTMPIKQNGGL